MSLNINPNFNMNNFDNSINEFNKVFNNSLNNSNENFATSAEFESVLNNISGQSNFQNQTLQAGIVQNIGLDSINAQKIENLSPTAQMANDIKNGFSSALGNVSELNRKADDDIETFASGGDISVHEVMISSQKAGLAMQMAIQLRTQMLNAYNEFKNMSV